MSLSIPELESIGGSIKKIEKVRRDLERTENVRKDLERAAVVAGITETIAFKLNDLIDKAHTGMLCIEIHMRNGGIGDIFTTERKRVVK